ncbi:MAG: hypothetical protein MJ211_13390 [Bacteroidales bacterium]|nr:hypothetical protein [Bacteroidales bacterium]
MKSDGNIKIVSGEESDETVIVLKKKKFPWWILLFLLLFVFLIPISRTVRIHISEKQTGVSIALAETKLTYPEIGLFGKHTSKTLIDTTNTEGKVEFSGIKEPLWYVLFNSLFNDSAYVSAGNECYSSANLGDIYSSFPKNDYKEVKIPPIYCSVALKTIDADDFEPIPGANIQIISIVNDSEDLSSTETDVAGNFEIANMPQCGSVKCIASKEGYENDTLEASLFDLSNMSDLEKTLKLKPLKGCVKVIVKNLKTQTLLPGATVTLTVNGISSAMQTNTNGVGVGLFDSLRISNTISFKASKVGYADTTLEGGTVKDFIEKSEEERTMYLRPLTTSLVFYNTDGSKPLEGVKNEIRINGTLKATEYSNAKGEFTVMGINENDKISITASKSGYVTNNTKVNNAKLENLNTKESRTIPLSTKPTPPPTPPNNNNKQNDLKGESGDLRINLQWYSKTDLDLHVIDPCGNEIFFSKRKAPCGGGTGTLDLDANAIIGTTTRPQENIYWLKPSKGVYTVKVVCFKYREKTDTKLNFNISIVDKHGRKDFSGKVGKGQTVEVTRYNYVD